MKTERVAWSCFQKKKEKECVKLMCVCVWRERVQGLRARKMKMLSVKGDVAKKCIFCRGSKNTS